jgi:hypothetical protein
MTVSVLGELQEIAGIFRAAAALGAMPIES